MDVLLRALEAFAVGDAMGMPTEFMTLEMIHNRFGLIDHLIDPSCSFIHKNLKKGQITDDTEQVLYLIETFYKKGSITIGAVVEALCRWIEETHAEKKGYVGPNTSKALKKIRAGENPEEAGKGGTTCGAAMRVLAPVLCVGDDEEKLKEAVWVCSIPTHNTNLALEAAMSLGFGFYAAVAGASFREIINSILEGARVGKEMSNVRFAGASTGTRIRYALDEISNSRSVEEAMSFVYNVIGTNMESNEVVPAAVSIFAYAKGDVWLAIRMGASIGGDTDTIAAIAGALSCLYNRGHNIPDEILEEVISVNGLDLRRFAKMAWKMRGEKL